MDSALLSLLTGILTIVGTTIAVSNYLNNRFSELTRDMSNLVTEQAVDAVQLREKLELLEYRINANTELINHRTSRFEKKMEENKVIEKERVEAVKFVSNQSQELLLTKINNLDQSVKEIQQFLAKKADFNIRN